MTDLHDLEILLRSSVPIVAVETREEPRIVSLFVRHVLLSPRPLYKWTITDGLKRIDIEQGAQVCSPEPSKVLAQIRLDKCPGIYLLADFHPFLDEPLNVRLLKDVAIEATSSGHTVGLISHRLSLPAEIEHLCARFELSVPTRKQVENLIRAQTRRYATTHPGIDIESNHEKIQLLAEHLTGLPLEDAKRLARVAIEDDGLICDNDLPNVVRAKFQLLARKGTLSFEFDTAKFSDVGGLRQLKEWLALRRDTFLGHDDTLGLTVPKGILMLGVQGCGKSLAAKAVAGSWAVPLLRLDFASLYNKFHGESERNLRDALRQAETMAPCALWIDEIEKGISADNADSGTSQRMLGSLLTWMAENEARVFIVATANNIQKLPAEMLRKGRLDEIFFVDLPDTDTRQHILQIHLKKRSIEIDPTGIARLSTMTEGFAGAELEQMVVSALYSAKALGTPLTTEQLAEECMRTQPLSSVMREQISSLRSWAQDRTVSAH